MKHRLKEQIELLSKLIVKKLKPCDRNVRKDDCGDCELQNMTCKLLQAQYRLYQTTLYLPYINASLDYDDTNKEELDALDFMKKADDWEGGPN